MHIDLEYEAIIQSNLMSNLYPIYCSCPVPLLALHLDTALKRLKGTKMSSAEGTEPPTYKLPSHVLMPTGHGAWGVF